MFLAVALTLVLRTGDKIAIDGPIRQANGVVVFHVAGGALYSIPEDEVDLTATRAANDDSAAQSQPAPKRLKVSPAERDRLIKQLEQSGPGTPAPLPSYDPVLPPEKDEATKSADEARWRAAARQHENAVRDAKQNLESLRDNAERLRASIRTYISLGWSPDNFSYLTYQLENVESQIPYAETAVTNAQRAYDDFRDDARKQGIMPGWLR